MGDILLTEVASRLQNSVREVDTAARIGGDEFCILLIDILNEENTQKVLNNLMEKIHQPVQLGDSTIIPSISMGVTLCHGESEPKDLIKRADKALYDAKNAGRDTFRFYEN